MRRPPLHWIAAIALAAVLLVITVVVYQSIQGGPGFREALPVAPGPAATRFHLRPAGESPPPAALASPPEARPFPLPDRSGRYLALLLDCLARERREAPERVRPVLEELARLDAPDPRIYRWLGLEAHRRGDEAEAISHFERAVRLAPRSAPDLFDLATLYLLAERYPEAIRTFDRVIRLQPPFLDDAYAYLGYCLDRMGAEAEARRAWRTALELDPDNAVARRYLSEAGLSPPPAAGGPGAAAPGAPPPRPPAPGAPGPGGR